MPDIEQQLRAAMRAAAEAEEPALGALIAAVHRRHRRRSALLACVAVVAAAVVAIPATIVVGRVVAGPAPAIQHGRQLPTGLKGVPRPAGTSLQFLMSQSNGRAAWYSTPSQTKEPITGLSSLASAGFIVFGRVEGGTWISTGCITICSSLREYYFIADGSHVATAIGAGVGISGVVASTHPGAVWLTSYPRDSHNVDTLSATTRLVSTSGQALGAQYQLPTGYWPEAAVGRYLLLWNVGAKPSTPRNHFFALWDPSTRRVVRYIDHPFAASHDLIAWTKGCRGCHVQILNVTTGKSMPTPLPAGPTPPWGTGSFSDNGQLLAYKAPVSASCGCRWGGAVDVYSVKTGALLLEIPNVSPSEWEVAGWLNGGPKLMVAAGPTAGRYATPRPPTQIGIWQPGDTSLRVTTVENTAERYALVLWVGDYDNLVGLTGP